MDIRLLGGIGDESCIEFLVNQVERWMGCSGQLYYCEFSVLFCE